MTEDAVLQPRRRFSGLQVLGIIGLVILLTAGVTFWLLRTYVYAKDFRPVELSQKEQRTLDTKLRQIGVEPMELLPNADRGDTKDEDRVDEDGNLVPERYSEDPEKRDIQLSERELNALIASNPDLARRFAIDLSKNLASAKLIVPVDPDMPFLGGKTLRFKAGLELNYRDAKPIVILRGVSVMGVPVPNAWLGNLKNVDLVEQFSGTSGFWKRFADGVELIEIDEGKLHIKLKE